MRVSTACVGSLLLCGVPHFHDLNLFKHSQNFIPLNGGIIEPVRWKSPFSNFHGISKAKVTLLVKALSFYYPISQNLGYVSMLMHETF